MTSDRPGRDLSRDDTLQLLTWLVFLHVVVSAFVLVSSLFVRLPTPPPVLYSLVSANVTANFLAAFFLRRGRRLTALTVFLIYWDIAFVTALVFVTGGIESPFSFMYIISLIYAGILLHTRGAVTAAVLCVGLYAAAIVVHALPLGRMIAGDFSLPIAVEAREVFFKVLINGIAFFVAAFLSNLISEQLRATGAQLAEKQDELASLRVLHENLVRSVVIGLLTTDVDARVTYVNPTAQRLLGLPPDRLLRRSFLDLFPALRPAFQAGQAPAEGDPLGRRWECPWTRADGEALALGFSVSDLRDRAGRRIGRIVSFQDLTALRRMEQDIKRADRLATVGKLAAGIAHEIRNPLASISGSIQVLAAELDLDPVNGSLMEIVLRETDRLNALISDFLDFARPAQARPEVVDANLLLDETIEMVRHSLPPEPRVDLRRDFAPEAFLRADSGQLRQVFLNLLLNAVQAMPRGGRIDVATRRVPPAPEQGGAEAIEIEVADTGAGIGPEVLENIFDPFFTTKESGTGLGLPVAYRIVENHGGRIAVDSEPGRGSRFVVVLPVRREPPAAETPPAEAEAALR
jgi:two-component system sensor histidine kinase PilS (NtrC family)